MLSQWRIDEINTDQDLEQVIINTHLINRSLIAIGSLDCYASVKSLLPYKFGRFLKHMGGKNIRNPNQSLQSPKSVEIYTDQMIHAVETEGSRREHGLSASPQDENRWCTELKRGVPPLCESSSAPTYRSRGKSLAVAEDSSALCVIISA